MSLNWVPKLTGSAVRAMGENAGVNAGLTGGLAAPVVLSSCWIDGEPSIGGGQTTNRLRPATPMVTTEPVQPDGICVVVGVGVVIAMRKTKVPGAEGLR